VELLMVPAVPFPCSESFSPPPENSHIVEGASSIFLFLPRQGETFPPPPFSLCTLDEANHPFILHLLSFSLTFLRARRYLGNSPCTSYCFRLQEKE